MGTDSRFYIDKNYKNNNYNAGFGSPSFIYSECSIKMTNISYHDDARKLISEVKSSIEKKPLYYLDNFTFNFSNNNIIFYVKTYGIKIIDKFMINPKYLQKTKTINNEE